MELGGVIGEKKKRKEKSDVTKEKDRKRHREWNVSQKLKGELAKQSLVGLETLRERVNELERLVLEKDHLMERVVVERDQLLGELKERDLLLVQMKTKLEFVEKIAENSKQLVKDLPSNSPYRRPLLAYLMDGLDGSLVMEYFGISKRTLDRIMEEPGNKLVETKYSVNVKRKRVTEQQLAEIQKILDDILPTQSGREWRVQEETNKRVYENYLAQVENGTAVSKTFFIYKVLKGEKIHHSNHPSFCPLCERYEAGDRTLEIIRHKELIPIQRGQYSLEKKQIGSGVWKTTALVTQDFTQIQFDGGFTQDLIICIYTHNSMESDGLERTYRHFVGNTLDKNGISFVVGCWKVLLEEEWFNEMTRVNIWSDGGPKHFKISANIRFLLSLQHAQPDREWSYSFFPSYHGCSVCDGVASHIKQAVNREMRDEHKAIRTPEEVVVVGNKLKHHEVSLATLTSSNLDANTLKGIKRYHKFVTSKDKNIIYAYNNSTQLEYAHRYLPRDVIGFDDIFV